MMDWMKRWTRSDRDEAWLGVILSLLMILGLMGVGYHSLALTIASIIGLWFHGAMISVYFDNKAKALR